MEEQQYTHICPKCGIKVNYKRKYWYDKAIKSNKFCKDCTLIHESRMYDEYITECLDSGRKLSKNAKQWISYKREERKSDIDVKLLRTKYNQFKKEL